MALSREAWQWRWRDSDAVVGTTALLRRTVPPDPCHPTATVTADTGVGRYGTFAAIGYRVLAVRALGSIIVGMLAFRLDKPVRVACGLGLLLLLAAEEKLCPWLLSPPPERDQRQADRPDRKGKKGRAKALLPHVLPDASAPRWSATWSQTALHAAGGAHDGVVSRGRENPSHQDSAGDGHADQAVHAWHCFLALAGLEPGIQPLAQRSSAADPAVRTAIWPLGPPSC